MQSLSQPSVKCGNSVSKLSSDPIPSVKLRPGSKWAGSRRRGSAGEEEEGRRERRRVVVVVVLLGRGGGSAH